MRFLHSIPLPLLLILSSFISFGSQAVSYASQKPPRRLIRSANDPVPEAAGDIEKLPFDELEKQFKSAEEENKKLNETIEAKKAELTQKDTETAEPRAEYAAKFAAWQKMDDEAFKEERAAAKAKEEFKKANGRFTQANLAFTAASTAAEKAEADRIKAQETLEVISNAPTRHPLANTDLQNMITDDTCKKLADAIKPLATIPEALDNAQQEFDSLELLYKGQQAQVATCQARGSCQKDNTLLSTLEGKLTAKRTALNSANNTYNDAVLKSGECPKKFADLKAEVAELAEYLSDTPGKMAAQDKLIVTLTEDETNKKAAKDAAEPEFNAASSEFEAKKLAKETAETTSRDNPKMMQKLEAEQAAIELEPLKEKKVKYDEEIDALKKLLKDLEEQRDQSNQKYGALKQVYEKKFKKEEPNTGSFVTIALAVVGALLAIAAIVLVGKFVVMPRLKKRGQPQTAQEPSAIKVDSHSSDAAKNNSQQLQAQPVPAPSTKDTATTKSNEAAPPTPAGVKSAEAAPVIDDDRNRKLFLSSVDPDRIKFEEFLPCVPDKKVREHLKAEVKPGSWVYTHKKFERHIFNLDNEDGNILILMNMKIVKYHQDANKFRTATLNFLENCQTADFEVPENPNKDGSVYWAAKLNTLVFVVDLFRNTLEETIKAKAATVATMRKWKQEIWSKEQRTDDELEQMGKKRATAGQEEDQEESQADDMRTFLEQFKNLDEDDVLEFLARIEQTGHLEALYKIFEQELGARIEEYRVAAYVPVPGYFEQQRMRVKAWMVDKILESRVGAYFERWLGDAKDALPQLTRAETDAVRCGHGSFRVAQLELEKESQSAESEVRIDQLPKMEDRAERSASGSEREDKRESEKKSDRSDKKSDKKSKSSRQQGNKPKKTSKDGKPSKNGDRKGDNGSSGSTESDPRSPRRDAIRKAQRKQNKQNKREFILGQRAVTHNAKPLPDIENKFYKEPNGKDRRDNTFEENEYIWKSIEAKVMGKEFKKLTPEEDAQLVLNLLCTSAKRWKVGKKYLKFTDNKYISCKVGDTHGNYDTVHHLFKRHGGVGSKLWKKYRFVFNGDFVDRGKNSTDLANYIFAIQNNYPDNVVILRGNHECYETNIHYGFYPECLDRFEGAENVSGEDLHIFYNYAFSYLPIACLDNGGFQVHGGLARHMPDDLEKLNDPNVVPNFIWEPRRSCYLVHEILWNDPMGGISGFISGGARGNWLFGEDVVLAFLKKHPEIKYIVRSHQVMNNGYEFFADRKLVCIFTTDNYDKKGTPNHGAVLYHAPNNVAWFDIFVGIEYISAVKYIVELTKAIQRRSIEEHNFNTFWPSMKSAEVKVAEGDCPPSETLKC